MSTIRISLFLRRNKKLWKIAFICFFVGVFLLFIRTVWMLSHAYTPDFSVYYQAARNSTLSLSVYTGKTIYTLFAYPLISSLFYIPFTFLLYPIAQALFLFLSVMALIGISWISPMLVTRKHSLLASALIFSFAYLSFPTKFTLGMGQINLISYLFLLLSFSFILPSSHPARSIKMEPLLSAAFFAAACMIKPILGFMLVFFILQKQWKIILYTAFFVALAVLLSCSINRHAIADYFYYLQHVLPEVTKPVGKEIYYNQGIMSFVFRETSNSVLRLLLSYVSMVIVLCVGVYTAWKSKNYLYQFSILLSTLPLIDTLSWQHHFVFLIFPFSYVAWIFLSEKKVVKMFLLVVAYILISINFPHPQLFIHTPYIFLLSTTFYGAFLLFILLISISPKDYPAHKSLNSKF